VTAPDLPAFTETVDYLDAPGPAGVCEQCRRHTDGIWAYSSRCDRCERRDQFFRLLSYHRHLHIHPRRGRCRARVA
jgi:hypothetical protein